jgi:GLPGLI family protein
MRMILCRLVSPPATFQRRGVTRCDGVICFTSPLAPLLEERRGVPRCDGVICFTSPPAPLLEGRRGVPRCDGVTRRMLFLFVVLLFLNQVVIGQITSGKIVYERKTNLYKKFKNDDVQDWIDKEDKNKVDVFELYFNDSLSVFKVQESDLKERMSWATSKNTIYQNFNQNYRLSIKPVWGEELYVEDTLYNRKWKITDSKRNISGYNCRKAIWQANDTTRIYAWYCDEIMTSVGPESFYGLPGAILGLATEDGGVIYFAKSVEVTKPDVKDLLPKKGKHKIYSSAELKAKLEKDFGKNTWGKAMIKDMFGIW